MIQTTTSKGKTMKGLCVSCTFWESTRRESMGYTLGYCRRYAPKPIAQTRDEQLACDEGVDGVWPITREYEWCGEFKRCGEFKK